MVLVKDIMTRDVVSIDIKKGLEYLIRLMAESKVSSVIIKDDDTIKGIVTERDLIKKILLPGKNPKQMKLADIMTIKIISVPSNAQIHEVSDLMHSRNIRHLPVIDGNKLMGVISQTDIVKETHKIHKENVRFMNWQNIQTTIILIFFIFLIGYSLYQYLK
jgi:CBS domain-containing protein